MQILPKYCRALMYAKNVEISKMGLNFVIHNLLYNENVLFDEKPYFVVVRGFEIEKTNYLSRNFGRVSLIQKKRLQLNVGRVSIYLLEFFLCIYLSIYIYILLYLRARSQAAPAPNIYIYIYIYIYVQRERYIHIYVYIYIYIYTYICIYIYTHTYIRIHIPSPRGDCP